MESFADDEKTRNAKQEMIYRFWNYLSDGNPIVRERAFGALLWAANRGMKSVDLAMREYWDALSFDAFDRNNPSSRSELRSHQFMEIVKDQTVNLESVLGEPGKQIELAYYGKIPVRSMQRKATGKFAAVIGLQGLKDYKILVNDGDKGIFDWGELYRTAVLEAEELKRDGEVVHPVFEGTDIVTLVNPNWRMEIEFQKAAGDHLEFEVYLMQRSEVRSKWEKRLHVLTSGTQRERIETTLNSLVKIRAKALEDHKSEIAGQALRHYEELQGLAGLTSEMMNFRLREVEEAISFVRQTARILDITDPKRAWAAVQTTVWAGLFSEGLVKRHDDPERQGEWVNVRDRAEVIFQQFRAAKKAEAKVPAPEVIASAEKLNDDFMKLFNQLRRSEARVAEERVMAKQVAQFAQAGIYDQADREPFPGASKGAFIEIPISRNGSMTFGSWRENKAADNRGKLKSLQIKVALKFKSKDGTVFLRPGMKGRISAHFRPVSEEDKKSRWLLELEFPEEPRFPKRVYFFKDGGLQMPPPEAVPVVNRELTDSEAAAVKSKQVLTQTILNAPKIRSLYDFYAWYRSMSDEELPSLMFQGKKMSMVTALSYLRKAKKLEHIYQISRDANADFYLEKHPEIRDLDISFNSSQVLDYWRWFYEKGGEKYFPSKRKKSPYLSASNAARVLVQAGKTSGNIKAFLTYVNEIRSAEVYKDIFVAEFERIFNGRTIPESQREVKDILYKEFRLDIAGRRYHRISIRAPIRFAYELYGRDLIEGLRARSESRVISEESRSEARSLKPISDHELVISYADMLAHIKQRAQTRELIKKSPRGKFLKPEDPKELRSELERKFPEAVLVQDWINRQILFLSPAFREDNFQVSLDFPNTPSSEVYPGQGALTFLRAEILERKKAAETYDFLFRVQNGKILMDIRKRDGQAYKRLHENQISMFISRFIESSAEPNFRELLKGISAASIYTGRSELRSPAGYRWAGDYTSAVRRVIRALEQIDHGNAEEKQKALHYLLDWQRKNGNRVVVYNRIYAPVPIILGHLKDPDFYPDKLEAIAKFMTQLPARELRRVITLLVIFSAKTDPETYSAGKTSSQIRFELLLDLGQQAYLSKDGNAFKVMIGMLHQIRKDEAYSKDEREKAAEALQAIPDPKEIESHLSPRSEMRKAAAYGENKRVLIDFKDLAANFSDEQIKEAAFMAKRSQGRDFQVLIYNLDPTDKLGKFFRSLRISNLKTDINDLNSASKRIQGFKGEVIHLSSQNFALQREKLAGALAKAGIQESSIYSFRYQDAQSGTLGVAMKDLENGLLKKQLPDHFSYDAHGNIILLDASLAASWQRLYDSSLVFARAA